MAQRHEAEVGEEDTGSSVTGVEDGNGSRIGVSVRYRASGGAKRWRCSSC